ncbi:helix-turn-helix domain-containing protein [Streptomyces shenzhenensis]|uniref:helix-turn-helix domain-containing protein n=1 Tax=Streptomyces shenzhenensis TaxID=943815 RepID=UPI0015F01FDF|nr:helix-turn-helix transcriptional regulator [Streptomyces shenzhenensis]
MADTSIALRAVALNVRAARVRAGLSQEELSRRSQVSKGTLVALENSQGNPSLATLVRLADALGMSLSALAQGAPEGRVRVITADAVKPLWTGGRGSEARLMLTTTGPSPVEVWCWQLQPDEEYSSQAHHAGVVETVSVTAGRMTLVVDGTEHSVEAGQIATFEGDAPHSYRGAGVGTCHLIMTVHLPPSPASVL